MNALHSFKGIDDRFTSGQSVGQTIGTRITNGGSRLRSLTYPSGFDMWYGYTGLDDDISRITGVYENAGTTNPIESYRYLGLSTPAEVRTALDPNANAGGSGGEMLYTLGSGGNYWALDAFGRIIKDEWHLDSVGPSPLTKFEYGYDQVGQQLYTLDQVNPTASELFHNNGADLSTAYDRLGKRDRYARGTLTDTNADGRPDTIVAPDPGQTWHTDPNGVNQVTDHKARQTDRALVQVSHGQVNHPPQETLEKFRSWQDASSWVAEPDIGYSVSYDAWGQLRKMSVWGLSYLGQSAGTDYVESINELEQQNLHYDALGRLIKDSLPVDTALTYDASGRLLVQDQTGNNRTEYLWSPVTGKVIGAEVTGDDAGRWLAQTNASGDVVALISHATGSVVERYVYDPQGYQTVTGNDYANPAIASEFWRLGWRSQQRLALSEEAGWMFWLSADGRVHDSLLNTTLTLNPVETAVDRLNAQQRQGLEWYDIAIFVSTAGLGIAAGVLTGGLGFGALATIGVGGATFAGFSSGGDRYLSGQSIGQSIGGGILDATPLSGGYTALTSRDIITGEHQVGFARWAGGADIALTALPWLKPGAKLLRTAANTNAGRIATLGGVGIGAMAYSPDAEAGSLSVAARFINQSARAKRAGEALELIARADYSTDLIRTFNPQVMRGAAPTGIDVGAVIGRGRAARLALAEVKDVAGSVRTGSLSALGLGRSGATTLRRNLADVRQAIGRMSLDEATRQPVMLQLQRRTFNIHLVGNASKSTLFGDDLIYNLQDLLPGARISTRNLEVPF